MRKTTRATKAKKSTGRKAKVGRPAAVAGLAKTKKFAGKTYTKTACSTTVTDARKKADSVRKAGGAARVVKNPKGGACVYTRSAAVRGKK